MELISSIELSSPASSISLSAIPNTYTNLLVVARIRTSLAYSGQMATRFNGDGGANYHTQWHGATTTPTDQANTSNQLYSMYFPGTSQPDDTFGSYIIELPNYSNTSVYKKMVGRSTGDNNTNNVGRAFVAGTWLSYAAITSIQLNFSEGTLVAGTELAIYGQLNGSGEATIS